MSVVRHLVFAVCKFQSQAISEKRFVPKTEDRWNVETDITLRHRLHRFFFRSLPLYYCPSLSLFYRFSVRMDRHSFGNCVTLASFSFIQHYSAASVGCAVDAAGHFLFDRFYFPCIRVCPHQFHILLQFSVRIHMEIHIFVGIYTNTCTYLENSVHLVVLIYDFKQISVALFVCFRFRPPFLLFGVHLFARLRLE